MQKTITVVSSSEIARKRYPPEETNERRCILGKAFEQAYCYVAWKIDGNIDLSRIDSEIQEQQSKKLTYQYDADDKQIEEKLMNDEITYCSICNGCWNVDDILLSTFNKESDWVCMNCVLNRMKEMLIEKAEETTKLSAEEKIQFFKIFNLFLNNEICGTTPPTKARKYGIHIVTAKPDLLDVRSQDGLVYNEFKIGQLNDYAREQARIFSWVVDEGINLYGISQNFELQKETIFPPEDIGEIPKDIGELYDVEEICDVCNLPRCNCKKYLGRVIMTVCRLTEKKCFRIGSFRRRRKQKKRMCNKESSLICPYSDGIPEHIRQDKVKLFIHDKKDG